MSGLIWQILLSNIIISGVLAGMAVLAVRVLGRKEVGYGLWVLVVIKLITPPIWNLPLISQEVGSNGGGEESHMEEPVVKLVEKNTEVPSEKEVSKGETHEEAGFPAGEVIEYLDNPGRSFPEWQHPEVVHNELNLLMRSEGEQKSVKPMGTNEEVASVQVAGITTETRGPSGESTGKNNPAWMEILLLLWVSGVAIYIGIALIRLMRFWVLCRKIGTSDKSIELAVKRYADQVGVRGRVKVIVLPISISPSIIWCLTHHCILIPSGYWETLDEDEKSISILHELGHMKRGDCYRRSLEIIVQALYWWYPLVWSARRSIHYLEEQLCDAWVIKYYTGPVSKYASLVVKSLEFLSRERSQSLPQSACGFGNGSNRKEIQNQKERITMILKNKREQRKSGVIYAISFAVLALAALPSGLVSSRIQAQQTPESDPNQVDEVHGESPVVEESDLGAEPEVIANLPQPGIAKPKSAQSPNAAPGLVPGGAEITSGIPEEPKIERPPVISRPDPGVPMVEKGKYPIKRRPNSISSGGYGAEYGSKFSGGSYGFSSEVSGIAVPGTPRVGPHHQGYAPHLAIGPDRVFGIRDNKKILPGKWEWRNPAHHGDYAILEFLADGKIVIKNNELPPQKGIWKLKPNDSGIELVIEDKLTLAGELIDGDLVFNTEESPSSSPFVFKKQRIQQVSASPDIFIPVDPGATPLGAAGNPKVWKLNRILGGDDGDDAFSVPGLDSGHGGDPFGNEIPADEPQTDPFGGTESEWVKKASSGKELHQILMENLKEGDQLLSPSFFTFEYKGEPLPGKRIWMRIKQREWAEHYPNGHVSRFRTMGRTTVNGNKGTLVTKIAGLAARTLTENDGSLLVFIPDKGTENPKIYSLNEKSEAEVWKPLGTIEYPEISSTDGY